MNTFLTILAVTIGLHILWNLFWKFCFWLEKTLSFDETNSW